MPAPSSSPLLVLRSYLGPLKWAVLTLALLLLTGTGLNLYLPQILGRFVDNAKLGAGADIALLSRLRGGRRYSSNADLNYFIEVLHAYEYHPPSRVETVHAVRSQETTGAFSYTDQNQR